VGETEGRLLLGLEPVEQTLHFLARQTDAPLDPGELAARVARARERREALKLARAMPPPAPLALPAEAEPHLRALRERALFQRLFEHVPVRVGLVDIASLIVIQPHVNFTYAVRSVPASPTLGDVLELSLPTKPPRSDIWGGVTAANPTEVACTIVSRDLNLHVTDATLDTDGKVQVTFKLGRTSVYVQVVESQGRFYLKDGTHRAVGLLAHGFPLMPAVIVRDDYGRAIPDYLPPGVLFSDNPPRVADFFDRELYVPHRWPDRVKFIRIRVDEFVAPHEPAHGDDTPPPVAERPTAGTGPGSAPCPGPRCGAPGS
jgi:hypothetical protein